MSWKDAQQLRALPVFQRTQVHGSPQLSETPVPGDVTCRQNTNAHKIKINHYKDKTNNPLKLECPYDKNKREVTLK